MEHTTLKKTMSISPISFEEVDAKVIREGDEVYLEKRDEKGELYKSLIETDLEFYQSQTEHQLEEQVEARHLLLYVSSRCNLNCPLCYENLTGRDEVSFEEIARIADANNKKIIVLMGREPTVRKDILKIIEKISEKNRCTLLTNGIKLADYDFTRKLKEAGLTQIIFGFNGFDDEIYRQMNGRPLLETKLKALENIKKVGIPTLLSITLARGINDGQMRELCDFCFENRSFIFQLRVRTATHLGRHIDRVQQFCMSEMLDLLADQLAIPKEDILREQQFWNLFVDEMSSMIPGNAIHSLLKNRLCSFTFTIRKDRKTGTYQALGSHFDVDAIKAARFKRPLIIYNLVKAFGTKAVFQNLLRMLKLPLPTGNFDHLMVFLRCWPNIYNIDLVENRKCPSQYLKDGKFLPFCYANILDTFNQQSESQEDQPQSNDV